jgi:hypothetical protein
MLGSIYQLVHGTVGVPRQRVVGAIGPPTRTVFHIIPLGPGLVNHKTPNKNPSDVAIAGAVGRCFSSQELLSRADPRALPGSEHPHGCLLSDYWISARRITQTLPAA